MRNIKLLFHLGIVHAGSIVGMSIVDSKRRNETELKREKDEEERNDAKEDTFGKAHLWLSCNFNWLCN